MRFYSVFGSGYGRVGVGCMAIMPEQVVVVVNAIGVFWCSNDGSLNVNQLGN